MKKYRIVQYSLIYLLLLLFSVSSQAQVAANATISQDSVQIGEQFNLNLSISSPEDLEITWPRLLDKIGDFEIIGFSPVKSNIANGVKTESQQFKLTSFDEGFFALPAIVFKYKENNRLKQAQTEGVLVNVMTVAVDTTQNIRPIKGIMEVPFTWKEAIPYVIKGLIAFAFLIGLIYFLRRYFKKEEVVEEVFVPPPPAHETALSKLKSLENAKLWERGSTKEYYSELTEILREYLEGRYEVPALESTSDEIMDDLAKTDLPKGMANKLNKLLMMADLAKFAKASPAPEDNKRNLKSAFDFVLHTKKKVVVVEEEVNS